MGSGELGESCKDFYLSLNLLHSGVDGTVSGWEETKINSSSPLRYDHQTGEFTVIRAGLYYLYCQVSPAWLHGRAVAKGRTAWRGRGGEGESASPGFQ